MTSIRCTWCLTVRAVRKHKDDERYVGEPGRGGSFIVRMTSIRHTWCLTVLAVSKHKEDVEYVRESGTGGFFNVQMTSFGTPGV